MSEGQSGIAKGCLQVQPSLGIPRIAGIRMLHELLASIRDRRPRLNPVSRSVLEAVMLVEGPIGSTGVVARLLGLQNRFALQRLLVRDHLPPLRRFSSWVLILSWVRRAEREGISLCQLALQSHRHPSACYRLVREVTGLPWKSAVARGSKWVEGQLLLESGLGVRSP